MHTTLYPAPGRVLQQVAASTGNVLDYAAGVPTAQTVANTKFSETFQANNARITSLHIVFAANAATDPVIEICIDQTASVAGITYATLAATGKRSITYVFPEGTSGYFRFNNTSGQAATVYLNGIL